jgi:hypothetical protein
MLSIKNDEEKAKDFNIGIQKLLGKLFPEDQLKERLLRCGELVIQLKNTFQISN